MIIIIQYIRADNKELINCDTYGGMLFNTTIDKYAYATIEINDSGTASFVSTDREKQHKK